ncbi:hypothetical protein ACFPC0_11085 [Streptomyces andamanensis]|uniref:Uncharacterized protein n=1 Tax=Streptomyces andamanensis TaxID=1565035 RepID=A0ABV8TCM0_9ACTN
MKGKQAAAAARRREAEAVEAAEKLRQEKADQRARYEEENKRLREELARARNEMSGRAAELAQAEIERVLKEKERERAFRGLSDDLVEALADKKDTLIYQACWYLSFRNGVPPIAALRHVIMWMTKTSYEAQYTVDWLVGEGLPREGWAATLLRQHQYAEPAVVKGRGGVPLLAPVEVEDLMTHPEVHPKYRPGWWVDQADLYRALNAARARAHRRR